MERIHDLIVQWRMFLQDGAIPPHLADWWDFAYRSRIAFFGPHLESGYRILDIGCREGVLDLFFGYLGCPVMGLDSSSRQIARNVSWARRMNLAGVHFQAASLRNLELDPNEGHDVIICSDILEYFEDPAGYLARAVRFLDDGGLLFLSLPCPSDPVHRVRMRLYGSDRLDRALHRRHRFTVVDIRELVNRAGLVPIEIREEEGLLNSWFTATRIGRFMQPVHRGVIKDLLLYLGRVSLERFGGSRYYAVARKVDHRGIVRGGSR